MENFWSWTRNGTQVVTTPDAIDIANEEALADKLHDAARRNPVVVVDTATCETFLSVGAMRILDRAGRALADAGGELRIVITKPSTRRHLALYLESGPSYGCLRIFRDLDVALAVLQPVRNPQLQPQAA
jgi:anti-anti-sigma regulatory factor